MSLFDGDAWDVNRYKEVFDFTKMQVGPNDNHYRYDLAHNAGMLEHYRASQRWRTSPVGKAVRGAAIAGLTAVVLGAAVYAAKHYDTIKDSFGINTESVIGYK